MIHVQPKDYFEGTFELPGDKSITHRAIMFNAFAQGEAYISNPLLGEDCLSTCACMQALGAEVKLDGKNIRVKGVARFENDVTLPCGNSGTTIRLLMGLLAGQGVHATLVGDESLSARPMQRVATPLSLLGAKVETTDGHAPVEVLPNALVGAEVHLPVASAQVKSAVLLAGLFAEGKTIVHEPFLSRDHTERMLQAMGAKIVRQGRMTTIEKSRLQAKDIFVPSDISSAAYFMALGALKGKTLCKNVGINPTRTGILKAFERLGVSYALQNERQSCGEETADILVEKSQLKAITLTAEDVPSMIDELPLIALLCAFAEGESVITGAKELRHKESDRIVTTANLIRAIGGDIQEREDGWVIRGKAQLQGGVIDSCLDHRIAMTGAIGLLASTQGGAILHPECCAISFPDFFEKLGVKKENE